MRVLAACASICYLVACGGGGDDKPDARPVPDARGAADAAPKTYCYNDSDENCGYTPAAVTPSEISLVDQQALAAKFNPAQVMSAPDIWGVSIDYALDNAIDGLWRAEHDGRLNFTYDVDLLTAEKVPSQPTDLKTLNMQSLPASSGSKPYAYYVDLPGDNTGNDADQETWSAEWRTIQGYATSGGGDPTTAPYKPHQYAHLFWLSKADDLLAIQYWFYYPYDKFHNNHEGDWEHVNVVLDYEDPEAPFLAFMHTSWHGKQNGWLASDLYRVGDGSGGDHVVVFVGGDSCIMYNQLWCGFHSGASWPYPGDYAIGYTETVAGDSGNAGRAIHADDFTITLLPRPEDLDFNATPNLSWYNMPFLAGDPVVETNDPVVIGTNNHRAPVGPSPDHDEFEVGLEMFPQDLSTSTLREFDVPGSWTLINSPPASVFGN